MKKDFTYSQSKNRGFTIIELLVVISIIAFLTSIVLVFINSARNKSKDTVIKSQLSSIRAATGLAFSSNGGYGLANTNNGCEGMVNNSALKGLMTPSAWPATDGLSVVPTCYSNALANKEITAYSMWHALVTGGGWCVDSTGKSQARDSAPNSVDCGDVDGLPPAVITSLTAGSISVSGGVSSYIPGGSMNYTISATASDGGSTGPDRGFGIQYSFDGGTNYSIGSYDSLTKLWTASLTAPSGTGPHSLTFKFYCSRPNDGICSTAQVETTLSFMVVEPSIPASACPPTRIANNNTCASLGMAPPIACNNSWQNLTTPKRCEWTINGCVAGVICLAP